MKKRFEGCSGSVTRGWQENFCAPELRAGSGGCCCYGDGDDYCYGCEEKMVLERVVWTVNPLMNPPY